VSTFLEATGASVDDAPILWGHTRRQSVSIAEQLSYAERRGEEGGAPPGAGPLSFVEKLAQRVAEQKGGANRDQSPR
jgi:hypothetical protein